MSHGVQFLLAPPPLGFPTDEYTYQNWFHRLWAFHKADFSIREVTANHTVVYEDHIILVDTTSGGVTVTLPSSADSVGRRLLIKKVRTSSHTVTITPNGSDLIDEGSSYTLNTKNQFVSIVADGTDWWIVAAG